MLKSLNFTSNAFCSLYCHGGLLLPVVTFGVLFQSTAIYQAKQKLKAIHQATKRKISADELIKYAHKISASNAVAAPPTWGPGKTLILVTYVPNFTYK